MTKIKLTFSKKEHQDKYKSSLSKNRSSLQYLSMAAKKRKQKYSGGKTFESSFPNLAKKEKEAKSKLASFQKAYGKTYSHMASGGSLRDLKPSNKQEENTQKLKRFDQGKFKSSEAAEYRSYKKKKTGKDVKLRRSGERFDGVTGKMVMPVQGAANKTKEKPTPRKKTTTSSSIKSTGVKKMGSSKAKGTTTGLKSRKMTESAKKAKLRSKGEKALAKGKTAKAQRIRKRYDRKK